MSDRKSTEGRQRRQQELTNLPTDDIHHRYLNLAHGVQSAVAYYQGREFRDIDQHIKHLRTGVDLSKAEMGGLAVLLMRKGVITEREYLAAVTEGVELEVLIREEQASQELGRNVKFG